MDGAGRVDGELKGVGAVSEAGTEHADEGIAVLDGWLMNGQYGCWNN